MNNRGRTRHSGRALRPNADRQVIERVTVDRGLLTASQAAERFGRRRSDVDHLIRTGWLQAAAWVNSSHHRCSIDPTVTDQIVPLYRRADLDALLGHPAFDWGEIRATPGAPLKPAVIWPPNKERRPEVGTLKQHQSFREFTEGLISNG